VLACGIVQSAAYSKASTSVWVVAASTQLHPASAVPTCQACAQCLPVQAALAAGLLLLLHEALQLLVMEAQACQVIKRLPASMQPNRY
jgi:hypothetical protein